MSRSATGFGASVAGALLVACGAAAYAPGWVLAAGGAVALLSGLASLGRRGSLLLGLAGAWLLVSAFLPWAAAPWNLMAGGLVVLGLGFLVGATWTPPEDGD